LLLPFVATALAIGMKSAGCSSARKLRAIVIFVAAFAAPIAGSLLYLYIRDDPALATNYIERCRIDGATLPSADAGLPARVGRIAWLVSGAQFAGDVRGLAGDLDGRARQVLARLGGGNEWILVAAALPVAGGLWVLSRRRRAAAVMLFGVLAAQWFYLLMYRVHDNAMDVLPVLFVIAITATVVADAGIEKLPKKRQAVFNALTLLVAACGFGAAVVKQPIIADEIGAERFLHELNVASLPDNTMIFAPWEHSGPLLYACHQTRRDDIRIRDFRALAAHLFEYPTDESVPLVATLAQAPGGFDLVPFRNVWRLQRAVTPPPP
jgi:hypothetical protein